MNNNQLRWFGITLVLTGSIFWGISGTVAQYLFQEKGFNAEWLVTIRLIASGILLLLFQLIKGDSRIWEIWKSREFMPSLLLFSLIGMLGVQYTYFAAIQAGNAATATLLQYLGPVLITLYLAIKIRKCPDGHQIVAVILALAGTFLLVTGGSIEGLTISGQAFFWGLSSAVALAFYTLHPIALLKEWGSGIVVGWGMLIGGVGMSFIHPPWRISGDFSVASALSILFVVLFGTLIAFYCYLESLKYIKATETSLLACAEPLSAAILSVLWLNVPFGIVEWGGAFFIMLTIVILSRTRSKQKKVIKAPTKSVNNNG